jgi:hypothetical protein
MGGYTAAILAGQKEPDTVIDLALSRTERRRTSGGRSRSSAQIIGVRCRFCGVGQTL